MRIAHTLGTEFPRYVDRLERPAGSAPPGVRITVADDAELPRTPMSLRPLYNLGLGLVIGLLAGVVGAVLRDLTDTSIRSLRSLRSLREVARGAALGIVANDGRIGWAYEATHRSPKPSGRSAPTCGSPRATPCPARWW
jgi:capsular polysaccharide biosynthesis protein